MIERELPNPYQEKKEKQLSNFKIDVSSLVAGPNEWLKFKVILIKLQERGEAFTIYPEEESFILQFQGERSALAELEQAGAVVEEVASPQRRRFPRIGL